MTNMLQNTCKGIGFKKKTNMVYKIPQPTCGGVGWVGVGVGVGWGRLTISAQQQPIRFSDLLCVPLPSIFFSVSVLVFSPYICICAVLFSNAFKTLYLLNKTSYGSAVWWTVFTGYKHPHSLIAAYSNTDIKDRIEICQTNHKFKFYGSFKDFSKLYTYQNVQFKGN